PATRAAFPFLLKVPESKKALLSALVGLETASPVQSLTSSRHEHDLADIAATLDMTMSRRCFRKREGAINLGRDLPLHLPSQDLAHPVADHVVLVPQMTDIHAEDAAVVIHELERVEAEPRYAEQGARRSEPSAAAHRGRQAEDGEPARRREAI